MTPTLTKREKELNKIIKLDPKLKAPTKKEYKALAKHGDSVELATELPAVKFMGKSYGPFKSYNTSYIENDGIVINIEEIDNKKLIMEATKAFFGIPFHMEDQLLYRISDEAYMSGEITDGDGMRLMDLTEVYKDWLLLCKDIDAIKPYIKSSCPEFDKKQKEYIKQFKDVAKEAEHIPFFQVLAEFFEHYSLKQISKAKSDSLANLHFPNIGKQEAKKIVEMLGNKKKYYPSNK